MKCICEIGISSYTQIFGDDFPTLMINAYVLTIDCIVIEWLLLSANSAISSAISWRDQDNFQWNDDEVGFVQDQHAQLDFYIASSLKQQSVDRHIATIGHIILIPS